MTGARIFPLLLLLGCDTGTSNSTDTGDTGVETDTLGGQEGEELAGDTATVTVSTALTGSTEVLVLGPETVGCVREDTLTVSNTADTAATIEAMALSAEPGEFTLTTSEALPLTLDPGASASFQVRYAPLDETADAIEVMIYEDATSTPSLSVSAEGVGTLYAAGSETFLTDGTTSTFALSAGAVGGTLSVSADGTPLPEGEWSYSADTDTITLSAPPAAGITFDIQYAVRPPTCD